MKKTNRFVKTLVFVLFIVFLCLSCENLFSPVVKDKTPEAAASPTENTGSGKKGMVKIAINKDAARTIYPDAPQFEKYRLEFEGSGEQTPQEPLEFSPSEISTAVLNLDPGIWTITAYGQVTFNGGLTDVATGSVTVEVIEGVSTTAPITLYSGTAGGNGSFSWSIAAPLGVEADTWSISLTKYKSGELPVLDQGGSFDSSSSALSQAGEINCSPGYYLLKVEVGNTKQRATRTEIVLIHSGLQSRAQFSFSEKDFVKLIRVSGTLFLSTSEGSVSGFKYLDLRILREKSSELLSGTSVNPDGTWEMLLPVQTESRTLSFSVNAETTDGHYFHTYLNSSVEIKDVDVEKNIVENLLILSGSTSGMDEGIDDILYVHVSDESVAGYYRSASTRADESGNWKMYLPTSTITFTPRFRVQIWSSNYVNRFFEKTLDCSIGTKDVSGISIDNNQITVSGTLEVLKDSLPENISYGSITMYKVGQNNSFGSAPIDESGNWIMSVEPLVDPVPVYFSFSGRDKNGNYFSGTSKGDWLVQASPVTGIKIVKEYITVSGTVNVTVDGAPIDPSSLYISMIKKGGYDSIGTILPNTDGSWSIITEPILESEIIYFETWGYGSNYSSKKFNGEWELYNTALTGIELSKDLISVSGTVNVTVDGAPIDPSSFYIQMRNTEINNMYISSIRPDAEGNWCIITEPFLESEIIYFETWGYGSNYSSTRFNGEWELYNTALTGINLSMDLISVSGTISISVNGFPVDPSGLTINMYDTSTAFSSIAYISPSVGGSWTMFIESFTEPVPVRFGVYGTGLPSTLLFDEGWIVSNTKVTDINLTKDVTLASVSGTLSAGTSGADFSQEQYTVFVTQESEYIKCLFRNSTGSSTSVLPDGTWSLNVALEDTGLWNIFVVNYGPQITYSGTQEVFSIAENIEITSAGVSEINAVLSELPLITKTISGVLNGFVEGELSIIVCGTGNIDSITAIYSLTYMSSNIWSMGVPSAETDYEAFFYFVIGDEAYMTTEPIMIGTSDMEGIELNISDMVLCN